jgi:hypothetical protein
MNGFSSFYPEKEKSPIIVPTNYQTIQSAIDAANPGSTIIVKPGVYEEQLYIDKPLNIIGVRFPIIRAPKKYEMKKFSIKGLKITALITIGSSNVTLRGFNIDTVIRGFTNSNIKFTAIFIIKGSDVQVRENKFQNIESAKKHKSRKL